MVQEIHSNTDFPATPTLAPTQIALANGHIVVGGATGVGADVAMSGDATIANTGAITIANSAVTGAKMAALTSGHILVGNGSNVATDVAVSGDVSLSNTGAMTINPARSKLVEDSLARYQVPLMDFRTTQGVTLTNTPGAGASPNAPFGIYVGGGGEDADPTCLKLTTGDISDDDLTFSAMFEFPLPVEYLADQDVKVVVSARYFGTGGVVAKSVDVQAYEISSDGSFSSDLCSTNAQTLTTSFANYTFTITDTNLAPGDRLLVIVKLHVSETGGSLPLTGEVGAVEMQLDVKG